MRSFLTLPTQRVTRYPLLLMAIMQRCASDPHCDAELLQSAREALDVANDVVSACNEGARNMHRIEQLVHIDRRLVYSDGLKRVPLVSHQRHIIKQGDLIQLWRDNAVGLRRASNSINALVNGMHKNRRIHLILLSDLLLVTKFKRRTDEYVVVDYCNRAFVDVTPLELSAPQVRVLYLLNAMQSSSQVNKTSIAQLAEPLCRKPHLFLCTLMHNARGKQNELLLCADAENDRQRWLTAFRPPVVD